MKLTVAHTLTFSLGTPPRAVMHLLLTAQPTPQQKIERWTIEMPGFGDAAVFRDAYGNRAHLVSLVKPEPEIVVKIAGVVETIDKSGVLGRLDYDPMPAMYRRVTELTKPDAKIIAGLKDGPDRIGLFHEVMGRVHETASGAGQTQSQDDGAQSQSQSEGAAAKPDEFAHGFVAALRGLGIPARHVTGYLLDEDQSCFHAWGEAWDDRLGWIGFDPMLNVCPTEGHIRIASGLDATATMPIRAVPVWAEMPAETVEIEAASVPEDQ